MVVPQRSIPTLWWYHSGRFQHYRGTTSVDFNIIETIFQRYENKSGRFQHYRGTTAVGPNIISATKRSIPAVSWYHSGRPRHRHGRFSTAPCPGPVSATSSTTTSTCLSADTSAPWASADASRRAKSRSKSTLDSCPVKTPP